jgi:predicted unusual protein kinase regulating ubiquinone biosynthesis (AarF/ABC1/UbiB family)
LEPQGYGTFTLNVVDFGMVGTIPPVLKAQLREGFIGVATRDVHRLVGAMQTMGWLLPGADLHQIERAADKAFARFWGISMGDLKDLDLTEVREFTREFRSLIYSMPFQIPSNVLFLGRAIGILSGLATQIDPHFNVFEAATPFAEKMIADETGSILKVAVDQVVDLTKAIVRMPAQLDRLLDTLNRGDFHVNVNETDRLLTEFMHMSRSVLRLQRTIVFMGLLISAIALDAIGNSGMSTVMFIGAFLSGAWMVLRG